MAGDGGQTLPEPIDPGELIGLPPDTIPPSIYTDPSDILDPPEGAGDVTIETSGTAAVARPTRPAVLRRTAPKQPLSLLISGEGALVNLIYGRALAKPKVVVVATDGNLLLLALHWGKGEFNSIENVFADKAVLASGKRVNYLGDQSQVADPWLAAAIAGYTDTALGHAYSVLRLDQDDFTNLPRFTAIVQGRKILDPRLPSMGALSFTEDGSGKVSMGNVLDQGSGDFTVEATSQLNSAVTTAMQALGKKSALGGTDAGWALFIDTTDKPTFAIADGSTLVTCTGTDAVTQGRKTGLAAVVDRTGDQVRLYVDGVEDAASPFDISTVTGAVDNAIDLEMGDAAGDEPALILDEVRLWNTARTQVEILDNLETEIDETDADLDGYWRLNDSGSTAADSKGSNDGTITGTTTWVDSLRVIPLGVIGYSANPALMFRDAATLAGLAVDDWSIIQTADACDEQVGGVDRRTAGVVFDSQSSIDDALATLAEYAGGLYVREAGLAKLIPNRPAAVSISFTDDETDGTKFKILMDSLAIRKISVGNQPNRVIVEYTETVTVPWRRAFASTALPSGDVRPTTLALPGITKFAQADRQAIERLNHYTLTDLEIAFTAFDEALALEMGDVFDVDHDDGLTAKKFRCISAVQADDLGHWQIQGREYDPAVYSDEAQGDPTFNDTDLPDPSVIPAGPTIVSVTEKLYQDETGRTFTRFEIKFTGTSWTWAAGYRIKVANGTDIILEQNVAHTGDGAEHIAVTQATSQGIEYTVEIWIVNVFGKVGATPSTTTKTGDGKTIPPTDVADLEGREAGQFINMTWTAAIDTDLRGYEIRRLDEAVYDADPGAAWDSSEADVIAERVDATTVAIPFQPVGTFYYMVKARDKSGNESVNAAAIRVEVTSDFGGAIAIQNLFDDFTNTMPWSRDMTQQAADEWDYSGSATDTYTFDQVGLLGDANTASRFSDTDVTANAWRGREWVDSNRPVVHTCVLWMLKETNAFDSEFGIETWDSVGPDYDGFGVVINKDTGEAAIAWDQGEPGQAYQFEVKGINIGGNDWWRFTLSLANKFRGDTFTCYVQPVSGGQGNVTEALTMGNMEIYPDAPFNAVKMGSAARINATASIPSDLLINMHVYEIHGANGGRYAVTSEGETWNDIFGAATAWDAVLSAAERWGENQNVASTFESNEWNTLDDRQGNWVWTANVQVFQGSIVYTTEIALKAAYPTFTSHSGQSINADAQYFKGKAELAAAAGNAFRIKMPVLATQQGRILEQIIETVMPASGHPVAVIYPESYAAIPEVIPRYQGSSAFFAVADAVTKTQFDLYLWDTAGVEKAGTVRSTVIGT